MRSFKKQVETEVFMSEVDESIVADSKELAEVIRWADALHAEKGVSVYELVKSTRSSIFGKHGNDYLAFMRGGMDADSILQRIGHFGRYLSPHPDPSRPLGFFEARALFSLENFKNKKMKTVFIQQYAVWTDGNTYSRACAYHDLIPEKQEEILDRFSVWMDQNYRYENTSHITIDDKIVRRFDHDPTGKVRVVDEKEGAP
jgi:hypothetical protein